MTGNLSNRGYFCGNPSESPTHGKDVLVIAIHRRTVGPSTSVTILESEGQMPIQRSSAIVATSEDLTGFIDYLLGRDLDSPGNIP